LNGLLDGCEAVLCSDVLKQRDEIRLKIVNVDELGHPLERIWQQVFVEIIHLLDDHSVELNALLHVLDGFLVPLDDLERL